MENQNIINNAGFQFLIDGVEIFNSTDSQSETQNKVLQYILNNPNATIQEIYKIANNQYLEHYRWKGIEESIIHNLELVPPAILEKFTRATTIKDKILFLFGGIDMILENLSEYENVKKSMETMFLVIENIVKNDKNKKKEDETFVSNMRETLRIIPEELSIENAEYLNEIWNNVGIDFLLQTS